MKKITINVQPEEFGQWLNEVIQKHNIDIDTNFEEISTIMDNYLFQLDTQENRHKLLNDLLKCDNIKSVKEIRKEKLRNIERDR